MSTTTIRVMKSTRDLLNEMSQATGQPMQSIVEQALDNYRHEQMLSALNNAYTILQENEAAWEEIEAERAAWNATLVDGLWNV